MPWWNDGAKEYCCKECPSNCVRGRLPKTTNAEKDAQIISKADIETYYLVENHSYKDTAEHFDLPIKRFIGLLKFYGINKQDAHKIAKAEITRSHESYVNGGKKSGKTQSENWKQKSEEEKQLWREKMKESHNTDHFKQLISEINYNIAINKTAEQKKAWHDKIMVGWWGHWDGMSDTEKQELMNRRFNNGAGYHTANSKPNLDFMKKLEENGIAYKREFRIDGFSYDFKIDKILIEINPSPTHNITWSPFENNKAHDDKFYHKKKTEKAIAYGYRCIHIWDWDNTDKIIGLLKTRNRIYARQCEIKTVDKKEAIEFLNQYHLQGYAQSKIHLGLYFNNELVSIMTFGKPRYNQNYEYELIRFCSKDLVVGGSEKLFYHFIHNYRPSSVISYCDNSKFAGDTYQKLGFVYKSYSVGKHWYNLKTREHITDNLLRFRGFDQLFGGNYGNFGKGTDNEDLMRNFGFVEIMDAGQSSYVYMV